jgi:hypothetical protein
MSTASNGSRRCSCEPRDERLRRSAPFVVADILRGSGFLDARDGELDDPILMRTMELPTLLEVSKAFAKQTSTISLADLVRAAASQGSVIGL